jgi:hypothetical protein
MARQQEQEKHKGELLLLRIAIFVSAVFVLIFLTWLIITLVQNNQKEEEKKSIYASYTQVTVEDLRYLFTQSTGGDVSNLSLSPSVAPMVETAVKGYKPIYILFYSESDLYNEDRDDDGISDADVAKGIADVVLDHIPYDDKGRIIFFLFNYDTLDNEAFGIVRSFFPKDSGKESNYEYSFNPASHDITPTSWLIKISNSRTESKITVVIYTKDFFRYIKPILETLEKEGE